MRGHEYAVGLVPVALALTFLHCGARTGLDAGFASELLSDDASARDGARDADLDASRDANAARLPCVPGPISLTRARPAVMFVLDRSRSMSQSLSGGTRWTVLTSALGSALPAVDQTMHVGALVYPSAGAGNAQSCTVPGAPDLAPAVGNVDALLGILRAQGPSGSTPTADALDVAGAAILGYRAATTARTLVLATDGAPDCNAGLDPRTCRCVQGGTCTTATRCLDDTRTVARIAHFAAEGVPTYVIGIQSGANVDYADVLDAMALAGGRPRAGAAHKYYAASSESDLTAALVAIRDQVGACTFLTSSIPGDEGSITVTIDGEVVPYDPTGREGWTWGNEANGEIVLLGGSCPQVGGVQPTVVADVSCGADGGLEAGSDAAP